MPFYLRGATAASCALLFVPLAVGSPAAPGVVPNLLTRAVEQYLENQNHWAYIESQNVVGLGGKPLGETLLQVDPSRNYVEQIKPLMLEGRPPTPEQIRKFQKESESQAKQRNEDTQKEEDSSKTIPLQNRVKLYLGGTVAVPDLEHTSVVAEDEHSVTYSVPFITEDGSHSSLLDRFMVTARINKVRGDLEHFAVRQRESFRVKLIARIAGFEEDADFTSVDPKYPSVMTRDVQKASISILFMKRLVTVHVERTALKHVPNYDERFGVKLGPMTTLKF